MKKVTSGTKQWAKNNINTHKGCPHSCGYCYAKMIEFNKGWKERGTWCIMEAKLQIINKILDEKIMHLMVYSQI